MARQRKYSAETKVRIVLEIISGSKSIAQASREYKIKDSLLYKWKAEAIEGMMQYFAYGQPTESKRRADEKAELERLVGKLRMRLEIAKKASHFVNCLPPESGI